MESGKTKFVHGLKCLVSLCDGFGEDVFHRQEFGVIEGIVLVDGCSCEGGLGDIAVWECLGDGVLEIWGDYKGLPEWGLEGGLLDLKVGADILEG